MNNVTPIRDGLEFGFVDRELQASMIRELNRDADRIALEARNRGRVEGMLAASLFVVIGLSFASFLVI